MGKTPRMGAMHALARWPLQTRVRAGFGAAMVVLAALIGWELTRSTKGPDSVALVGAEGTARAGAGPRVATLLSTIRGRRLFEPAVPLPARNAAKQSVDRIRGLLSLHAIMNQGGEPVAYIHIKDDGMRAFRVGEGVEDLFKVTRIEGRVVEVEIVGERIVLEI